MNHQSLGLLSIICITFLAVIGCKTSPNAVAPTQYNAVNLHIDQQLFTGYSNPEMESEIEQLYEAYRAHYYMTGAWPAPLHSKLNPPQVVLTKQGRHERYSIPNTNQTIRIMLQGNTIQVDRIPTQQRLSGDLSLVPRQGFDRDTRPLGFWKKPRLHLIFVGDSHTAKGSYPNACVELLQQSDWFSQVSVQSIAQGGATPAQITEMLSTIYMPPLRENDLKLAVVLAGTNAYNIKDYKKLVTTLRKEYQLPVVMLQTPPRLNPGNKKYGFPHSNTDFNKKLEQLQQNPDPSGGTDLESIRLTYSNHTALMLMPTPQVLHDPAKEDQPGDWLNPKYAADHTHLNKEGYQLLGKNLGEFILARMPRRDLMKHFQETVIFGPYHDERYSKTNYYISADRLNHWTQQPKPNP